MLSKLYRYLSDLFLKWHEYFDNKSWDSSFAARNSSNHWFTSDLYNLAKPELVLNKLVENKELPKAESNSVKFRRPVPSWTEVNEKGELIFHSWPDPPTMCPAEPDYNIQTDLEQLDAQKENK